MTKDNHVVSQDQHTCYGVFAHLAFVNQFVTDTVKHEKVAIVIADNKKVLGHA